MEIVYFTPEQCVYPYNLATSDPNWRKKSINYFIENIHSTVELETDKMLITSGIGNFSITKEESWKYASESIYQIMKVAEREGITLALEPLTKFESNLIINTRELKRMIEEIQSPSLKGIIDTVAMNLPGETPENYFLLLKELCHFHLIDGDSKTDSRLGLDDGNLQWRDYVKCVQKHQYDGAYTLEIMGSTYYQNPLDAVKKSLEKLNELGIL